MLLGGYRGRVGLMFVAGEDCKPHATMMEGDDGMDIGNLIRIRTANADASLA